MKGTEVLNNWIAWLTESRLKRWNHIRERAGLAPITQEDGSRIFAKLALSRKWQEIEEIKARIAE